MVIISESFNYLDPGTGSYLFQVIIAAGVTIGVYFRNIKYFVTSLLNKNKKQEEES
tara:strand:- start:812 stop:979 length:168 start_codon:yes stop_codon:yes gene_type:complete